MSRSYDADVKNLLGEPIYNVLLKAVDEGKIDQQNVRLNVKKLYVCQQGIVFHISSPASKDKAIACFRSSSSSSSSFPSSLFSSSESAMAFLNNSSSSSQVASEF